MIGFNNCAPTKLELYTCVGPHNGKFAWPNYVNPNGKNHSDIIWSDESKIEIFFKI